MSLVSIIMPAHNAERWITDTIDSITAQTYPDIELIVVDDASRDSTVSTARGKLAADFRHSWKLIELDCNVGPSAARNIGLRAASGSWVQYLDSDDFMAPTKLAHQMAYCRNAPEAVTAVYSPYRRGYVDHGKITWDGPLIERNIDGKSPLMCLVSAFRPLPHSGLVRRAALEQIGGLDESLRFWECEELNVRLARAGRLETVPSSEPMYVWRIHRGKIYIGGEEARYRSTPVALGWIRQVLKAAGGRTLDELDLPAADRDALLDDCTLWARLLYSQDRPGFRQFLALARTLDPLIAPRHPRYITAASRHIGYESAEGLAKLVRLPRTVVRKTLQRLRLRPQNSWFDWE